MVARRCPRDHSSVRSICPSCRQHAALLRAPRVPQLPPNLRQNRRRRRQYLHLRRQRRRRHPLYHHQATRLRLWNSQPVLITAPLWVGGSTLSTSWCPLRLRNRSHNSAACVKETRRQTISTLILRIQWNREQHHHFVCWRQSLKEKDILSGRFSWR